MWESFLYRDVPIIQKTIEIIKLLILIFCNDLGKNVRKKRHGTPGMIKSSYK